MCTKHFIQTNIITHSLSSPIQNLTKKKPLHTGVVVYGTEYYFGRGIQEVVAGTAPYGTPMRVVDLGITRIPKDIFEIYLQEIAPRYTAESYSLLAHNCNNFSSEITQFLVGGNIPEYILNIPNEVMGSPMGALIMPMIQTLETTMRAGAVPQAPQFRQFGVPNTSSESSISGASSCKDDYAKPKAEAEGDLLGNARSKVQEEIGKEFAAIMASGTFRASEAAALATRKVMQKYGHMNTAQS